LKLQPPPRGSIIRYAYLWADEHQRGWEEARKERPVLVLALSVVRNNGTTEVLVVAITHSAPSRESDAVALPAAVKRQLGLDGAPSWIVTTEANAFLWPGPDIRPVPGRKPSTVVYGEIPEPLLRKVARSFLDNRERQRARLVLRT
jgi:hypothetical protein